ncbi:MAG TPA: EAL domain-containing protein, partial [Naasia sp.]
MTVMDEAPLRDDLRAAVYGGQITAAYQPQIDIETGRTVAAEMLCRWRHPTLGPISPGTFIPIAEQDDLIVELGDGMLGEGSSCAIDWLQRGTPIEVSINVSAVQLAAARFFERLVERTDYLELPHHLLTVEITESQVISDMPFVIRRLDRL